MLKQTLVVIVLVLAVLALIVACYPPTGQTDVVARDVGVLEDPTATPTPVPTVECIVPSPVPTLVVNVSQPGDFILPYRQPQ